MFGFFNAPRVSYSYYRPAVYRQRYIPIEAYLLNSIRKAQEYEKLKSLIYKSMMEQQQRNEIQEEKENEIESSEMKEKKEEPKPAEEPKIKGKSFYYFESHSSFDGHKMIQEQKERKTDSEGKVHQKLKRRLGDKWYETEEIKDEEGKTTIKESWHNVSENEIDEFKNEWMKHIGYQPQLNNDEKESENNEADKSQEINSDETEKNDIILPENTNEITSEEKNEAENNLSKENEEKDQDDPKIINDSEVNSE